MVGCPTCGAELTYIPQYKRDYCYGCRSYAPQTPRACKICNRALVFVQQYRKFYCYGCEEYKDTGVQNPCPNCGGELQYVPEYDRFFCTGCKEYAPKGYSVAATTSRGQRMSKGNEKQEESIGYAQFSREEMDLASKEQLMEWCRDYGLDDSGLKYELRLRLLEHVRRQRLLLKGETAPEEVPEEPTAAATDEGPEGAVAVQQYEDQPEVAPSPGAETYVTESACPTCGQGLTYIPQYESWFCYSCQSYATQPSESSPEAAGLPKESQLAATTAVKVKGRRQGNPKVGISLAAFGLLMYIADELLFRAPAIFDIPVFVTAPEIDFALRFLSTVFVAMGLMAAVLLVRPRR